MTSLRERNRTRAMRDIESAALQLFEEQGYENTTVEQIARSAGASSATFFRYFGSKEEVLFTNEQAAVEGMIALVAQRKDPSLTLAALADPIATFVHNFLDDGGDDFQRQTRLVMTTPDLEARSMRMRLRWEHALARQFAHETSRELSARDVLLSTMAIACLQAALWQWQSAPAGTEIGATTRAMFEAAAVLDS